MINRFVLLIGLTLISQTVLANQTILVFGDSLSAAYGIPRESGWVSLLQQKLLKQAPGWKVVNASVSGETTSGGKNRLLPTLRKVRPSIVILELGANDGLRGLALKNAERNLAKMIAVSQANQARVLLIGMRIPPNYGFKYTTDFEQMYVSLTRRYKTALLPFLLEGVAENPDLMQADGLHPTSAAQSKILQNVWPALHKMLIQ